MSTEQQPTREHLASWKRDTYQVPDDSGLFLETHPTGYTSVTCTCGLSTGPIPDAEARVLIEAHSPARGA